MTTYQRNKIDEYFSLVNVGDFIYAGHLKSKLGIDIKKAYEILEELKEDGFLTNLYEVYCTNCSRSKGLFLNSIKDFKEDMCCEFCDYELKPLEDLIVLYKVVSVCKE